VRSGFDASSAVCSHLSLSLSGAVKPLFFRNVHHQQPFDSSSLRQFEAWPYKPTPKDLLHLRYSIVRKHFLDTTPHRSVRSRLRFAAGETITITMVKRRKPERSAVADIVDGCTDAYGEPKPEWQQRKEDYLAHLRDPKTSASIRLLSAADKLHNVKSILTDYLRMGEPLWRRFTGGRDDTLWYYRAVVEALQCGGETGLIRELNDAVTQLEIAAGAPSAGHGTTPPRQTVEKNIEYLGSDQY
jgi:hypothetical protein